MEVWHQNYLPFDSIGLSALAASGPIILFFVCLALLRMKGHVAAALTLALSLVIAIAIFHMPAGMAFASAFYGFFYGLWPIAWIIIATVFVYKVAVRSGQFDIIRSSITGLTDDRRLQMLLIGFSFGAFLEGAAGFGAPVAITAALLVGLGFNPLYAAGLCLIADTAPVAFGALGIPVIVAGQVSGLSPFSIGAMAGRQLPFMSIALPFWLVFIMDGKKGLRETWPAALVAGASFALTQYLTSNFLGPELPDVASSIVSLVSLGLFLKLWQPKLAFAPVVSGGGTAAFGPGSSGMAGIAGGFGSTRTPSPYSTGTILKAWSPFLILTATITVWGMRGFKALFGPKGALATTTLSFHMPCDTCRRPPDANRVKYRMAKLFLVLSHLGSASLGTQVP